MRVDQDGTVIGAAEGAEYAHVVAAIPAEPAPTITNPCVEISTGQWKQATAPAPPEPSMSRISLLMDEDL
jgi:hypothetical protein